MSKPRSRSMPRSGSHEVVISRKNSHGDARVVPYVLHVNSGDTVCWKVDRGQLGRARPIFLVEFAAAASVVVHGPGGFRARTGHPVRVTANQHAVVTGPRGAVLSYMVEVSIGGAIYSDNHCPSIIIR
jgi:hypothetical protein